MTSEKPHPIPSLERKLARHSHLSLLATTPIILFLPLPVYISALSVTALPFLLWIRARKLPYAAAQAGEAGFLQVLTSLLLLGAGSIENSVLIQMARIAILIGQSALIILATILVSFGKNFHFPYNPIAGVFRKLALKLKLKKAQMKFGTKSEFDAFQAATAVLEEHRVQIELFMKEKAAVPLKTDLKMLCRCFEQISDQLDANPRSAKEIRQYINYFPQEVARILNTFKELSIEAQAQRVPSIQKLLEEVIKTSEEIRDQVSSKKEMALDTQVTVMQKNIELGGF